MFAPRMEQPQPVCFIAIAQCPVPVNVVGPLFPQAPPLIAGMAPANCQQFAPNFVCQSVAPFGDIGASGSIHGRGWKLQNSKAAAPQNELDVDGPIRGRVWALSQDATGCLRVQRELDDCANDASRAAIAEELRGYVWEALCCPHANYVLQKCIVGLRPQDSAFVIDELRVRGNVCNAARHQFGCRILQRLLEHCSTLQVHGMVEDLMVHAVELARHSYGKYVINHLLEFGTPEQQRRLVRCFAHEVSALGSDIGICTVFNKALNTAEMEDRVALARALVREQGLLVRMALRRHGHRVVCSVLGLLEGDELSSARSQILAAQSFLCTKRYGRLVVARCK